MKTKTIIASIMLVISFLTVSCSKDKLDITQTDYEYGETYRRKFYCTGGSLGHSFKSECGRLYLEISSGNDAAPPADLVSEMQQYINSERNTQLKHYLVAEINFTYQGSDNLEYYNTPFILGGQWRIVIGSLEEYIYKDKVYERLVIR